MKPAFLFAISGLLLASGCQQPQVVVQAGPNQSQDGVVVSGTATVRVKPTLVVLQLGASFSNVRPAAAKEQTEQVIQRVVEAVRKSGVEEKDVQTTTFTLNRQVDRNGSVTGWGCRSMLEIRVKKVETAGAVLEAALDAGANQVSSVEYTVEELQAVRAQARDEACKVAKAKADQFARNFGVALGKPRYISENGPSGWYYGSNSMTQSMAYAGGAGDSSGASDNILSSGSVAVTLTVNVTYDLK